MKDKPCEHFVLFSELHEMGIRIGRRQLLKLMACGDFPKAYLTRSGQTSLWRRDQVEKWIRDERERSLRVAPAAEAA